MNRVALFSLSLVLCCSSLEAKKPAQPANFSGTWVLDFTQSKDLPPTLENYSMVVSQNQQNFEVKTTVKGNLNPRQNASDEPGQGGPGTGYPGGGYPGGGYPGGGPGMHRMGRMGMPGVGFPGGRAGAASQRRVEAEAFTLYPADGVFSMDGSKSSGKLGGKGQTDATLMADWAKKGKMLTLVMAGDENFGGTVKIKDQWKFSKDGQSLMVDRTVHTSNGSKTLHLVFYKKQAQ
jgi:hypothetical protein